MIPIAFVAYNRPHYFRRCLDSLEAQTIRPEGPAFLFLDGPEDRPEWRECVKLFHQHYPAGIVHGGPHIGSNQNFKRATFWPFLRLAETQMLWLIEEDLEFLPRYYEQMGILVKTLQDNPAVGTTSAWGCGSRGRPLDWIVGHKDELIEGHNHCGSIIFRRAFDAVWKEHALLLDVLCEAGPDRPKKLAILNQKYPLKRKPNGDFCMGGGWDEIYQLIMRRAGLHHLTTTFRLMRHIGEHGKNSNTYSWTRDWSEDALPTHELFTSAPSVNWDAIEDPRQWHLPETAS